MVNVKIDENKNTNKPVIETIINTAAIALTGTGVAWATAGKWSGCVLILLGVALEFFKYWGRKKDYWG